MVRAALNAQNVSLPPAILHQKYEGMSASAHAFLRGTNALFWQDFATDWRLSLFGNADTATWLQGDLHVESFGAFCDDRGEVVFDLNDFDESVVADYQFDLWRLAVSLSLVADEIGNLSRGQRDDVIDALTEGYLDNLIDSKKEGASFRMRRKEAKGELETFLKKVEKESQRHKMLNKWAPMGADGHRAFDFESSKLGPVEDGDADALTTAISQYRTTLRESSAFGEGYFDVRGVARRLRAGLGSLGTPRFYVLIAGQEDGDWHDDRILDVKWQAEPVALTVLPQLHQEDFEQRFVHAAEAATLAYRKLTRHTDDHTGWLEHADGCYSVRERSPHKRTFPLRRLESKKAFEVYAAQLGKVLATAHARGQENLGGAVEKLVSPRRREFRRLVRKLASIYALRVYDDWRDFCEALDESKAV